MATYTLKYNRTTNHIDGLQIRTHSSDDSLNYSLNACSALSRTVRWAIGPTSDNLTEILETARLRGGRKLCKSCEKAALAELGK
ncbi:hypothetical protein [Amycolatopsis sp. DSM 110486]|uniref:hypothetical protein n=1 Tax=Amycolatopsis sp. DSM 110486 TaxID=2865832 RepID=UPI001C694723|nr:hypothetical protein [Amycolatopsis sp. DSM 110486]QYN17488.1 hypothetical protein K1T34_32400 [Amycolatopsis sp. DSM 110486]